MSETPKADLFRFEVPTSQGVFVVIGPDTLPSGEAERAGRLIARLLPIFVLELIDDEPGEADPNP